MKIALTSVSTIPGTTEGPVEVLGGSVGGGVGTKVSSAVKVIFDIRISDTLSTHLQYIQPESVSQESVAGKSVRIEKTLNDRTLFPGFQHFLGPLSWSGLMINNNSRSIASYMVTRFLPG